VGRNYGIDVLKALAMFMVVVSHILLSGGILLASTKGTMKYFLAYGLEGCCICAVNCFVLATGFVMYGRGWRVSRGIKLWAQVFTTGLAIGCFCWLFELIPMGGGQWVGVFFPVFTEQYWFVTQYAALFMLMPILNNWIEQSTVRTLSTTLAVSFVVLSVIPSMTGHDLYGIASGYHFVWFSCLYVCGSAVAKCMWHLNIPVKMSALTYLISVGGIVAHASYLNWVHKFGIGVGGGYAVTYASSFVFLAALSLLICFARINVGTCVAVFMKWLSPLVFGVYLIHSNPLYRRAVGWNGRFASYASLPPHRMLFWIVATACLVYFSSLFLEWMRALVYRFVEKGCGAILERVKAQTSRES